MNAPYIQEISLKNFRCFTNQKFCLNAPLVVIEGDNGSGKTSLLEAIHYLCYVRSFRTHSPRDLITFDNEAFFIAATVQGDEITVGSAGTKRRVKINDKPITSHAQLRAVCKVVTVTQEDLEIVKESPEKRRSFLDHAILLHHPHLADTMKAFRHALEVRNAFLVRSATKNEEFDIWTYKVWTHSRQIQEARQQFLQLLRSQNEALTGYFLQHQEISLRYRPKRCCLSQSYEEFFHSNQALFERECLMRRSLFGAHLDDIELLFGGKPARTFSSRGQQKLLTLFLKIAQVAALRAQEEKVIFLVDDFLSDFDEAALQRVLKTCLSLDVQLILTTPLSSGPEHAALKLLYQTPLKISI